MAPASSAASATVVELAVVFSLWMVLNIGLNYYNRWLLGFTNFRFPFLLTISNKTVGMVIAVITMSCKKGLPKPTELWPHFLRPIVHVQGIATALNIGLNNWSLLFISLTMNQVLKSCVPLPTALLSVMFEGKSFDWQLYGSMAVLVLGCVLAAYGALGQEPIAGILLCLCSIFATAAWTVSSAVIMQMGEKPLDAVSLLFVSGPTCIATLCIFFVSIELPRLIAFDANDVPPATTMAIYLGIASLMASTYDIVHNQFVKITSSVNMAIMGNSKVRGCTHVGPARVV